MARPVDRGDARHACQAVGQGRADASRAVGDAGADASRAARQGRADASRAVGEDGGGGGELLAPPLRRGVKTAPSCARTGRVRRLSGALRGHGRSAPGERANAQSAPNRRFRAQARQPRRSPGAAVLFLVPARRLRMRGAEGGEVDRPACRNAFRQAGVNRWVIIPVNVKDTPATRGPAAASPPPRRRLAQPEHPPGLRRRAPPARRLARRPRARRHDPRPLPRRAPRRGARAGGVEAGEFARRGRGGRVRKTPHKNHYRRLFAPP